MLVSHDRSLLRSVCDEFWLVTRGGVENFAGDLDDYQRYLLEEARRNRESLRESQKNSRAPSRRPPSSGESERKSAGNLKALQRDQGQVEKQLLDLQTEQHSLEARLSTPLSAPELADVGRRLQRIAEELTEREEIWLGLADRIDALTRQAAP